MNDGLDNLVGSLAGAAIGAYVFAVVWHGNTKALGTLLKDEEGYIEFIVALFIIGMFNKYGPTGKVSKAITVFAVIAVAVRVAQKTGLNTKLADFASGKITGLQTIKDLFSRS